VRLYAAIGDALIVARAAGGDPFAAIEAIYIADGPCALFSWLTESGFSGLAIWRGSF
jgi:hypothetical protein